MSVATALDLKGGKGSRGTQASATTLITITYKSLRSNYAAIDRRTLHAIIADEARGHLQSPSRFLKTHHHPLTRHRMGHPLQHMDL